MCTSRWLVAGTVVFLCTACTTLQTAIARRTPTQAASAAALQVPFVPQSELLCGGAAIAMIERWWGRRGVHAEEFSSLVQPTEGGIRTTDMESATRARGWLTQATSATAALVQQSVRDSVPVIALIQIGPNRYHYVVVTGWSDGRVIYHDPAVRPNVTVSETEFLRRWNSARAWAMFVRPATAVANVPAAQSDTSSPTVPPAVAAAVIDSLPCRPWLDQAADAASENRLGDAERILSVARTACPHEPLVIRELAGVRFRQGAHGQARQLADEYTRRAASDSLGWQILGSSRYLTGDEAGALRAWNVVGRPTLDLLRIDGTQRVRFRVLDDAAALTTGAPLTPDRLAMATRRLADIPALGGTRVSYRAVPGGMVEVSATVVERPVTDPLAQLLVIEASRAAATRQITVGVNTPLGLGERWTVHWRWRHADPRVALRLDIPATLVAPVIVRMERTWETFRFSSGVSDERRRASAVGASGWVRPDLEMRTGARFERWTNSGDFVALHVGGALHRAHDRVTLTAEAEHAIPVASGASYDRVTSLLAWTLPADRWSNTWSMRAGGDWNTSSAPRGVWAIAGGGLMRAIPLRAHPLIIDNLMPAARIGRMIVHGGVAGDRHAVTVGPLALGAGIFIDAARIRSPGDGSGTARLYLDAGAGLRASLPGVPWAAASIDLARGMVTDRRWGVTAAFLQTLPVRLSRPR